MENITQVDIIKYLVILELPTDQIITNDIVKNQYYKLYKIYNPYITKEDKYKDGDKFKMLNEAYKVLSSNIGYVNQVIRILSNKNSDSNIVYKTFYEQENERREVLYQYKENYREILDSFLLPDFLIKYSEVNQKKIKDLVEYYKFEILKCVYNYYVKKAYDRFCSKLYKIKTLEKAKVRHIVKLKLLKFSKIFLICLLFFLTLIFLVDELILKSTISFESNGGLDIRDMRGYKNEPLKELPIAYKEGYSFNGWYYDPEFNNQVTELNFGESTTYIYAKWTINHYNISYRILSDESDGDLHLPLNNGETIVQVSLGSNHSAAITSLGRIFTWGFNYSGQLGDGTTENHKFPADITNKFNLYEGEKIVQVSLGTYHSSAITSLNRIFTWGLNYYGQLGDGTTIHRSIPVDITSKFRLSEGEKIIQLSLKEYHSSAITSFGRIFTWGALDKSYPNKITPSDITKKFNLSAGEKVIQVSLGVNHLSAITSSGRIFMWGFIRGGQLVDGIAMYYVFPIEVTSKFVLSKGEKIIQVSLGEKYSYAITSCNRIFEWGIDNITPIDITNKFDFDKEEKIVQVTLGSYHYSVLTSFDNIFIWGANDCGQLGNSSNINTITPIDITNRFYLYNGEKIIQVSLGDKNSSVVTSFGRAFLWGTNYVGQLGDGTEKNKNVPYNAVFDLVSTETLYFNEPILEYLPKLENYAFSGWYSDEYMTQEYTFSTMPSKDITLYGRWYEIE